MRNTNKIIGVKDEKRIFRYDIHVDNISKSKRFVGTLRRSERKCGSLVHFGFKSKFMKPYSIDLQFNNVSIINLCKIICIQRLKPPQADREERKT